MGKHSVSANTRQFFTSGERAKAAREHGSEAARLGEASQRTFDMCGLCLARPKDPVASPSGFLFCRECILASLLSQRAALDSARVAYADSARARQAAAADQAAAASASHAEAFAKLEGGTGAATAPSAARQLPSSETAAHSTSHAERARAAEKSAFWIPAAAPSASTGPADAAPDPCPRDPCSGAFLRAKQLITLRPARLRAELTPAGAAAGAVTVSGGSVTGPSATTAAGTIDSAVDDGLRTSSARFMCPACVKAITFQKTYVAVACGHVLCADCTKRFTVPERKCFECSMPVTSKKDIIALQQAGSSFVAGAGTQAEAKVWAPSLLV